MIKFPIPYRSKNKWGFCNEMKQILIKCDFDEVVISFCDENFELALVKLDGKLAWLNLEGKIISAWADKIIPFTKDEISILLLDMNNFKANSSFKNCLFINRNGDEVFELDLVTCSDFRNGFCIALFPNKKYGAINSMGEIVIKAEYSNYNAIWEYLGKPMKSDMNILLENEIKMEMYRYYDNGFYGFKDKNDNIILKPIYKFANEFREGYCAVALLERQFHHIDSNGQRLYAHNYFAAGDFKNGISKVVTTQHDIDPPIHSRWGIDYFVPEDAKWGYIDFNGIEFWED